MGGLFLICRKWDVTWFSVGLTKPALQLQAISAVETISKPSTGSYFQGWLCRPFSLLGPRKRQSLGLAGAHRLSSTLAVSTGSTTCC